MLSETKPLSPTYATREIPRFYIYFLFFVFKITVRIDFFITMQTAEHHYTSSTEFKHTRVQLVVLAALCDKVVVAAAFDNTSVFQHHDGVAVAYRAESVRNYKHRAAFHKRVHTLFNQPFGTGVDTARCLVKDKYRRIGNGCAISWR